MSETDDALAAFEKNEDEEYRVKGWALCAYTRGDQDAAFEWLNKAVDIDEGGIRESRQVTLLKPLHQDPRWQDFLERLGISDAQLANIRLEVKLPE